MEPKKSRQTILVVEDIEEIALQMQRALSQRGYEVIRASSAEEAVRIAEETSPALVLTDFELPTLHALVGRLKEHRRLKDMRVAVIDLNGPRNDDGLKVLEDFDALDEFVNSLPSSDVN